MTKRAMRRGQSAPGSIGSRFGLWSGSVAVLALIGWAVPSAAAAQFAVYPVDLKLDATDRVATQTLTVENQSAEPLTARVYLNDYDRDAGGGHQYVEFGEHPNSCAGRLEVFPDQLSLQGGERAEIRLRMEPGAGTCWGVVFIERRTLTPSGITVAQRIGAKVLTESPGLPRAGEVAGMTVDSANGAAAVLSFQNQGEGGLEVEGEVEVRDMAGQIVEVVAVEEFHVLPGRHRRVRVALDHLGLAPGRYLLVGILDFGGDYLAGAQTLLEVAP